MCVSLLPPVHEHHLNTHTHKQTCQPLYYIVMYHLCKNSKQEAKQVMSPLFCVSI